ncbi:hypothetical protein AZH11_08710 [Pseudomonas simiae]|nr:hypothetical protein AZH11_08710 [Pseudomonas simiae]
MKAKFDPDGIYDVIDPEGFKVGVIKKGQYFEGDWQVGSVEGDNFVYNGRLAGNIEGLTLTRLDSPDALETRFLLKLQTGVTV